MEASAEKDMNKSDYRKVSAWKVTSQFFYLYYWINVTFRTGKMLLRPTIFCDNRLINFSQLTFTL